MAKKKHNVYLDFYKECIKNDIHDFNSEKNVERAKLIAKKLNLDEMKIVEFYESGLNEKQRLEREKEEADTKEKRVKARNKDKELYEKYTKYNNLKGRDKPIAALQEQLVPLLQQYSEESAKLGVSFQEQETDWAIAGGLASGIAGGAAGLAVALDVQAENARIREKNKEMAVLEMYLKVDAYENMKKLESQINTIKNKIEKYETKLLSKESDDDVFTHVNISNIEYSLTKASSLLISANASVERPYLIYDDIEATVDGTLYAAVYYDNQLVGATDIVLPKEGIKNKTVTLKGIALYLFENENVNLNKIDIEIGPKCLWAIE